MTSETTWQDLKVKAGQSLDAGLYSAAIQQLTQALQICPPSRKFDQSVLLSNRSGAFMLADNPASSLQDAEAALSMDPAWARPHMRKAVALLALKQVGQAAAAIQAGREAAGDDEDLLQLAAELKALGHQQKAPAAKKQKMAGPVETALRLLREAGIAERQVGVTIVSGFLGSGKTTLVKWIMGQSNGVKIGVVVNDMAETNIDSELLTVSTTEDGAPTSRPPSQDLVELSNGCICCSLRGDLVTAVARLRVQRPQLQHFLIESTGIGEPLPIAAAFSAPDGSGASLERYFRVDTMVTVVDAPSFLCRLRQSSHPVGNRSSAEKQSGTGVKRSPSSAVDGSADKQPAQTQSSTVPTAAPAAAQAAAPAAQTPQLPAVLPEAEMQTAATTPEPALAPVRVEASACRSHQKACRSHQKALAVANATEDVLEAVREPAGNEFALTKELSKVQGDSSCDDLAELLMQQVEFADVVLVNKCDLVQQDEAQEVERAVGDLNPQARVILCRRCQVEMEEVVGANRFDLKKAELAPRWAQELIHSHHSESDELEVDSTVFNSRRPFHPSRLWDAVFGGAERAPPLLPPVLRSKGFFWIASLPSFAWEWSTTGSNTSFRPYGQWLAHMLPRHLWLPSWEDWDPDFGDRKQRLVFIGRGLDKASIQKVLGSCLLTDEELEAGEEVWESWGNAGWEAFVPD